MPGRPRTRRETRRCVSEQERKKKAKRDGRYILYEVALLVAPVRGHFSPRPTNYIDYLGGNGNRHRRCRRSVGRPIVDVDNGSRSRRMTTSRRT